MRDYKPCSYTCCADVKYYKSTQAYIRTNRHYTKYCLNMSIIQWSLFQCSWLFTLFMIQFKSTLQLPVLLLYVISFRIFHIIHFVSMIKVFTNLAFNIYVISMIYCVFTDDFVHYISLNLWDLFVSDPVSNHVVIALFSLAPAVFFHKDWDS